MQQNLERELAYTTVQTMLNILHRKGKVKRALKERAYFYKPAVTRLQVISQHVGDIVERLFGGSAVPFGRRAGTVSVGIDSRRTRCSKRRHTCDNRFPAA